MRLRTGRLCQMVALSLCLLTVTALSPGVAHPWPVFRSNQRATGVASSSLPDELDLVWKCSVKDGAFEATAVIADGVVYVGDMDGTLFALDLKTGEKRWKMDCEIGFAAAAGIRNGRVYVGDMDGKFYCVDAASGKPIWDFQADLQINGGPNFHGAHVLFGSQDATLYCLNAVTGELAWKHAIDDQIRCFPTIADDRAFLAGCDGRLHIVDLIRNKGVAEVKLDSPTGSTPAAWKEYVYFGTSAGTFYCVDWKEAKVNWKYHLRRNQSIRSSAAVTDDLVVFGGRDRQVHALDPTNKGKSLWTFPTQGQIDGSPVIVGDRVWVGSADGRLYNLDRKTGKKVWEFDAGGRFVASPAVADGFLIIGNDDGTLYAFGEVEIEDRRPKTEDRRLKTED